jgi:hypothetical protein
MKNNGSGARRFANIITSPQSEVVVHESVSQAKTNLSRPDHPNANHSRRRRGRAFFVRSMAVVGLIILYLWPAIWNRGPFYFLDTRTYIRSVDAALNKVTRTRTDWTTEDANSVEKQNLYDIGQAKSRSLKEITKKGIMLGRSLYWGLLLYIGCITGGFWLTIVFQSAGVLVALYLTLRTLGYPVWPTLVFVSVGLAFVSDIAFFACLLLPDLFVGFALLASAILFAVRRQMGRKEIAAWYLFLSGALLCHDTCILTVAPLLGVAVFSNLCRRSWSNWRGISIILLALVTAYAGQSLVTFGIRRSTHQAPLRFPLLEARLIADGPGTSYLRATCPQSHFALCEYVKDFPMTSNDFLFGTDPGKSVYELASYERRRDLSAEQLRFFLAVLRYDPAGVLRTGLLNTWAQFLDFSLSNFNYRSAFKDEMERTFPETAMVQIRASLAYHQTFPAITFTALVYLFVICSLTYLLLVQLKMLPGRVMNSLMKRVFVWAFAGLVLNAAISGGISFAQQRYQARVVWIIPLVALLVESQRWVHRWREGSVLRDAIEMSDDEEINSRNSNPSALTYRE